MNIIINVIFCLCAKHSQLQLLYHPRLSSESSDASESKHGPYRLLPRAMLRPTGWSTSSFLSPRRPPSSRTRPTGWSSSLWSPRRRPCPTGWSVVLSSPPPLLPSIRCRCNSWPPPREAMACCGRLRSAVDVGGLS